MHDSANLSIISIIPFALMLCAIAVMPIAAHKFWDKNKNKFYIGTALALPAVLLMFQAGLQSEVYKIILHDYIPFVVLLGALFVISGGIHVEGDLRAKPKINVVFLALGAVFASLIGTTGAAMLLIRPFLATNRERKNRVHSVLFFIAIVANCGGLLTPLGDPPLFMMYLRGVSFFWFLNLFKEWFFVNAILILIYYFTDLYYYRREDATHLELDAAMVSPIKINGKRNIFLLLGVVISVAFINPQFIPEMNNNAFLSHIREIVLIVIAAIAFFATPSKHRENNNFLWHPIIEVAVLFYGIFITMAPALVYLETHSTQLGLNSLSQYYFYTGSLSAFLDNTPTAVAFYQAALGSMKSGVITGDLSNIVAGIPHVFMQAICLASVFFGAMTYIGNGPNFMVKAIAEQEGIKMPHFFAYMFNFSLIVLLPLFIITRYIFL